MRNADALQNIGVGPTCLSIAEQFNCLKMVVYLSQPDLNCLERLLKGMGSGFVVEVDAQYWV